MKLITSLPFAACLAGVAFLAQPAFAEDLDKPEAPVVAPADADTDAESKSEAPAEAPKAKTPEELKRAAERAEFMKVRDEIEKLRMEKDRIEAEMGLSATKAAAELSALRREREKIEAQRALEATKLNAELAPKQDEINRLKAEVELESARVALKSEQMRQKERELSFRKSEIESRISETAMQIAKLNKEQELKTYAASEPVRTTTPFVNGVLTISDRRIPFNGPVTDQSADDLIERIHFFNNQDEKLPIFVVIDASPGGSVSAGARILEAMKASKAPVHVVVKTFAASMAAVITTLAEESYASPNAMILHHQMSAGTKGNMRQMREQYGLVDQWFNRVGKLVADKMGVSVEEMVAEMYKHNSDGDWQEFAEGAQKLKWVKHVATEIRETGITRLPDASPAPVAMPVQPARPTRSEASSPEFMQWRQDATTGELYIELPPLAPYDCYFIYDPKGMYRWR